MGIYTIPNYSEDRSVDVGKSNKEKLIDGEGNLKFTSVYIHLAPVCNFNCRGCYTAEQIKSGKRDFKRLDFKTVCRIIDFAKDRGAESIAFAGAGEPTLDPDFDRICDYIATKKMKVVLFTNCTRIKSKEYAKRLLLNGPVMGKLYSLNEAKFNDIARRDGAFKETTTGLRLLIEAKNELVEDGSKTILGVESYVTKSSAEDLVEVLRFCGKNGIIPYFEAFIEICQSKKLIEETALSEEELANFFKKLRLIDEKEFGNNVSIKHLSRVYGQDPCFRTTHFFCASNDGSIQMCTCSLNTVGQITNHEDPYPILEGIFDGRNKSLLRFMKCNGCSKRIKQKFL